MRSAIPRNHPLSASDNGGINDESDVHTIA